MSESSQIIEEIYSEIRQKEKRLLQDILPINEAELAELLLSEDFLDLLRESMLAVVDSSDGKTEAGFKVIRDWESAKHHFSKLEIQANGSVDLDNVIFPTYEPSEEKLIDVTPDESGDPDSYKSWKALSILNFHWHPYDGDDRDKSSWFNTSAFDLKSMSSEATFNSLKLRVESGLSPKLLRSLEPPNTEGHSNQELEKLHQHYGFFCFGLFAPRKLKEADLSSIEAVFRPFSLIGMALSSSKAQVLILRDNPVLTDTMPKEPELFNMPIRDLEDDGDALVEIEDFYRRSGYDSRVMFLEVSDNGKVDIRFSREDLH
ncbi:MAG: hypothetical protein XD95_0468 [Microgenomates bacterium 39_7]|nr:MAG: hypothetical protein XD95_0468 [Microgenomates bacterium 39_7]